jgi:hypothetical protein
MNKNKNNINRKYNKILIRLKRYALANVKEIDFSLILQINNNIFYNIINKIIFFFFMYNNVLLKNK